MFLLSTINQESIKLDRTYVMIFFICSINQKLLPIDRMFFFDRSSSDWVSIEPGKRFGMNFFTFLIDRGKGSIDWMLCILNFSKCFHTLKVQGYVWWDYMWFLIKNLSFKLSSGREIQDLDLTASIIGS